MYKERPYKVRQGEIYYVDFPESRGSVQKGIRPVIIIQNNRLNRNSTTFVCALITSQIKRLDFHEHVLLPEMKGLPKRSMVMAEQQATVALEQLIDYRGRVDWEIFKKINSAVRICEKTKKEQY
ncbi:type II toxin-antitoxin system PemK/MazF family toxin [Anaerovoracaceae bacterium Sow4_D4]